jgi:putative endonuclease
MAGIDSDNDANKANGRRVKVASPARVRAFHTGLSAETQAAAFLIAKGYRILARRFRTPHGEIDIVARRRNLLAFVEVKARTSLDEAAYAVTQRQQARIIAAAQIWLMAHPEHEAYDLRFDDADCAAPFAASCAIGLRREPLIF